MGAEIAPHGLSGRKRVADRPGRFLQQLSAKELDDLGLIERSSRYPAGVDLFTERDPVQGIFIILDGEVKLSVGSFDGRRLNLAIARKGDLLGLAPALSGDTHEVTAAPLYPSTLAYIDRFQFLKFLTCHPEVYQALTVELTRHVAIACGQLRTLGLCATIPERLARLLLDWTDASDLAGPGARLRFAFTHEEIGEFIGASRESVTRTLTKFKHHQLVSLNGSILTIPSRTALESYAAG